MSVYVVRAFVKMREVSQGSAEPKACDIAAWPVEIVGVRDDLGLTGHGAVFKATREMASADRIARRLPWN